MIHIYRICQVCFLQKQFVHIFLVIYCQLRKQIRASGQKIVELKNEIDSGKLMEMSLAKSKSLCEAQMKALDKKYNGKRVVFKIKQIVS